MQKKMRNVEIGQRIQSSRERRGLTQEALAEAIDRSPQFISTIERGIAGPSLETVISICDVLNVSCDWILRGREAPPSVLGISAKLAPLNTEQLTLVDQLIDVLLGLVRNSCSQE